jgi:hypothetical protein
MKIIKDLFVAVVTDAIINGVPYYILQKNNKDMSLIFIVSAIICLLIAICFIILYNKLQRFSRSVIDIIFSQANLNEELLKKPENSDIKEKYLADFDSIRKYRPFTKDELNGLYAFDPKNPHKPNNLINEPD